MFGRNKVSSFESVCVDRKLLEKIDLEFKSNDFYPKYEIFMDELLTLILPGRKPKWESKDHYIKVYTDLYKVPPEL